MSERLSTEEIKRMREELARLDPFTEDEGPEWQRIADALEWDANLPDEEDTE